MCLGGILRAERLRVNQGMATQGAEGRPLPRVFQDAKAPGTDKVHDGRHRETSRGKTTRDARTKLAGEAILILFRETARCTFSAAGPRAGQLVVRGVAEPR